MWMPKPLSLLSVSNSFIHTRSLTARNISTGLDQTQCLWKHDATHSLNKRRHLVICAGCLSISPCGTVQIPYRVTATWEFTLSAILCREKTYKTLFNAIKGNPHSWLVSAWDKQRITEAQGWGEEEENGSNKRTTLDPVLSQIYVHKSEHNIYVHKSVP